ncbi:MAG: 3'-5' exonuclease, partial [Clostridiales bacterium]|nr:3'-5' exonuclease [Clostridiales bacterium]
SEYDKPEKKTKSEKKPDNTNNSVQLSPDISSVIATNSEINEEATVQNKQDTAVEDVTESILKQDSVPIVKEGNITLPPMPPEDEKLEKAPTPMQKDNVKKTVLDAFAKHSEVIFFDTETSGFKPKDDRILELAAKKYAIESGQLGKQLDELHVYIKPPFSIRQEITDINGISDEFLTDKPIEEDAFIDIFNFFGENPQIIVAHNTVFDNNFMSALYERQEKKFDPVCKLDTLDMAHEQLLNLDNYKLETVASHLGIQGEGYHTAVFDTDRLVDVFVQLYKKYIENNINETEPANGSTSGKLNPKIISLSLFDKSEKLRRIYVNTDKGTLYYDLVNKSWASKDAKIDSINMEYLEKEAWKHAGAENQTAFEKFKGSYSAAA